MKHYSALLLMAAFMSLSLTSLAQKGRKQVKDSLSISCILLNAKDITPQKREDGMEELKLVLSSESDTTVRAGMDAVISKVQRTQEGKWEVVYYHQDYWFWMSGISKVTVKPNQKVKAGDAIGINETGEPVELLVYDFETPVDPKKYLKCGQ
jgi:hypothetical protein